MFLPAIVPKLCLIIISTLVYIPLYTNSILLLLLLLLTTLPSLPSSTLLLLQIHFVLSHSTTTACRCQCLTLKESSQQHLFMTEYISQHLRLCTIQNSIIAKYFLGKYINTVIQSPIAKTPQNLI